MLNVIKEKEKGFNHIQALAFNRRASSIGETKALTYIENQLKEKDIKSKRDYFQWKSPIGFLIKIGYLLLLVNLIIFRQILIVILYFIIKHLSQKLRNLSMIPKETSKNLYSWVYSEEKSDKKKPIIIFTSHYDSISAIVSYRIQKFIFTFYKVITAIYVSIIIFLLVNFYAGIFNPVDNFEMFIIFDLFLSIFGILAAIPLLIIALKEKISYGSIDNASGVAVNIELAKLLHDNPLKNFNVLFLWTGAEEWGMKGSKYFCENYFDQLKHKYDLERSLNINIDMVGSYIGLINRTGLLKKKINNNLNQFFISVADKRKIKMYPYSKLINLRSDHRSFKKFIKKTDKKFQISCIHSDKDSKYIHSSRDTPDKCSSKIINNCIRLCYFCVKELDSQFVLN